MGEKKSPKSASHESHADAAKKPDAHTSQISPNDTTTNNPKSYLSRLFSPENLPNIALFVAGVVGIIVAICTLRTLREQTRQLAESVGGWPSLPLPQPHGGCPILRAFCEGWVPD